MSRVLNFTLCPQNDKKTYQWCLSAACKESRSLCHSEAGEESQSLRHSERSEESLTFIEFLVRLITIDLALE